jgi:ribosomal protein S18 acetylase RimI-like enzyme
MEAWLAVPNNLIKVLVVHGKIYGYCRYRLCRRYVKITDLIVVPAQRRKGNGLRLVKHVKSLLRSLRRRIVAVEVPTERTYLPAQLLFKRAGFLCFRTLFKGQPLERYVLKYTLRDM